MTTINLKDFYAWHIHKVLPFRVSPSTFIMNEEVAYGS